MLTQTQQQKIVKNVELNTMNISAFFEYANIKEYLIEYKCLCFNRNFQKSLIKTLRIDLPIHTNFLSIISITLLCCCEKMFTHMNT